MSLEPTCVALVIWQAGDGIGVADLRKMENGMDFGRSKLDAVRSSLKFVVGYPRQSHTESKGLRDHAQGSTRSQGGNHGRGITKAKNQKPQFLSKRQ